jgi:subtilase family serine protease
MTRFVRSRLWAGLAAGVLAVAAPVAATAGVAQASSSPSPNTLEKVPTGILASALQGASAFGTTPASTPERVSFVLKEKGKQQLAAAVTSGLGSYDSVGQFAGKYGQDDSVVAALTSYLATFGIKTTVYPGNIDVSTTGTAGEYDAALDCIQKDYHVPAQTGSGGSNVPAQTVYSATGSPKLPYHLSKDILAVLGLTNYAPFISHAEHQSTKVSTKAAKTAAGTPGDFTPTAFAQTYHLTQVGKKADGAGETLGVVTLATVDPGAPQYFWKNVAKIPATGRTFTAVNVDGGSGKPSDAAGTGETDLDLEQSGSLAPGANVIVYQAPNTDPGLIDAFFTAASSNVADSVSVSWGESETVVAAAVAAGQETAAYEAAFDEAFLEMADQGQTVFDAAGDAGAYDDSDELGTTELVVDTPADSPYVTAAGGTTLPWHGTLTGSKGTAKVSVAKQRAWGWDYLWAAVAKTTGTTYAAAAIANAAGGGGGFSTVEPEPSYQRLVSGTSSYAGVKYLTPTKPAVVVPGTDFTEPTSWSVTSKPPVVHGSSSGRVVPDLSANADPESGYLLYEPSAVAAGGQALAGGWGGTSFVAPQFNGSAALIDSYVGHRTGLWNPALYSLASGASSPVTPLNTTGGSNDNLFYTGRAGTQYNAATGLGVPNLTKLATDLAG